MTLRLTANTFDNFGTKHAKNTDPSSGSIQIVAKDESRNRIEAVLDGFLTERQVRDFFHDEKKSVAGMNVPSGRHVVLLDATTFKPQSETVVDVLAALMEAPPIKARGGAIVLPQGMTRLQLKRILSEHDHIRFFDALENDSFGDMAKLAQHSAYISVT